MCRSGGTNQCSLSGLASGAEAAGCNIEVKRGELRFFLFRKKSDRLILQYYHTYPFLFQDLDTSMIGLIEHFRISHQPHVIIF